ncbi:MAG TPA: methionine biosynthesis protein MetW, partial [Kiloniellaceae bacterium]
MSPLDTPLPKGAAIPAGGERTARTPLRPDLALIAEMVVPGSRVLDIGCSDGALLEFLAQER